VSGDHDISEELYITIFVEEELKADPNLKSSLVDPKCPQSFKLNTMAQLKLRLRNVGTIPWPEITCLY